MNKKYIIINNYKISQKVKNKLLEIKLVNVEFKGKTRPRNTLQPVTLISTSSVRRKVLGGHRKGGMDQGYCEATTQGWGVTLVVVGVCVTHTASQPGMETGL